MRAAEGAGLDVEVEAGGEERLWFIEVGELGTMLLSILWTLWKLEPVPCYCVG